MALALNIVWHTGAVRSLLASRLSMTLAVALILRMRGSGAVTLNYKTTMVRTTLGTSTSVGVLRPFTFRGVRLNIDPSVTWASVETVMARLRVIMMISYTGLVAILVIKARNLETNTLKGGKVLRLSSVRMVSVVAVGVILMIFRTPVRSCALKVRRTPLDI